MQVAQGVWGWGARSDTLLFARCPEAWCIGHPEEGLAGEEHPCWEQTTVLAWTPMFSLVSLLPNKATAPELVPTSASSELLR